MNEKELYKSTENNPKRETEGVKALVPVLNLGKKVQMEKIAGKYRKNTKTHILYMRTYLLFFFITVFPL